MGVSIFFVMITENKQLEVEINSTEGLEWLKLDTYFPDAMILFPSTTYQNPS